MTHIVKRHGHKQEYDDHKIYASVYAACLSAGLGEEGAEDFAKSVSSDITNWIKDKEEVTSTEIFHKATELLGHLSKEAALMYSTHRDLS